jgi:hypothetical protein
MAGALNMVTPVMAPPHWLWTPPRPVGEKGSTTSVVHSDSNDQD